MSIKSIHQEREIVFFQGPAAFRKWLMKFHAKEKELFVGYYKKSTGLPTMTWSESVDQALCFGWIDGIRRSIDQERYYIRFTPRNPKSIWSKINLEKMEVLLNNNLVAAAGRAVYDQRNRNKVNIYSFEQTQEVVLKPVYLKKFKADKPAYTWFVGSSPSYKKTAIHWVMSAKQEVTQSKRLHELISDSAQGLKIKSLRR